uniref:Uncharacterized protein n=1 Tax=Moniliophthora roreri TaxID=221103 RepID=A0A0W0FWD3_MONRR
MALANSTTPKLELRFEEDSVYALVRATETTALDPSGPKLIITLYHRGNLQLSRLSFSTHRDPSLPILANFTASTPVYSFSQVGRPVVLCVVRVVRGLDLGSAQAMVSDMFPAQGEDMVSCGHLTDLHTTVQYALRGLLGHSRAQEVYKQIVNQADDAWSKATSTGAPWTPVELDLC